QILASLLLCLYLALQFLEAPTQFVFHFLMNPPRRRDAYSTHPHFLVKHFFHFLLKLFFHLD
ncbi:hypothetical protein, partial [Legionella sp. 29fVS95]|uniref:hypothetical protein n=1 Tax=Legionella sp. 29fVS95 TaxID=3402813 RepID=UPI003AF70DAB